jgi:tripartite ATP-independent transporter DctM subunit
MSDLTAPAHVPAAGIERILGRGADIVSVLAVAGMLTGAMVIVADVLLRWLFGTAVIALNEVMSQVFAMAIAATLPAGAARRVNLKVDLLGAAIGPRLTVWLTFAGSLLLAALFAYLAWRIWSLGLRFQTQGRATLILNWPIAPTYFFVCAALAIAALVQVGNAVQDHASLRDLSEEGSTTPAGAAVVGATVVLTLGALGWGMADFDGMAAFAANRPGWFLTLAFVVLWFGVLAQLPLAAVTGFIGLFGTALFVGMNSAGNVFATDAMEFLTNSQVATLPLFLMMGSFAVAAGISDDIYRLAYALLGGFRGGLAYATIAGCAGFSAVSSSSVATAATFGRIALPQMAQRGYASDFASGTVAAGGTLGALVPPSGTLVLFALLTETSIGTLFVASLLPAVLAIALYFAAVAIIVRARPDAAPADGGTREPVLAALGAAAPMTVLFTVVIGGIYTGIFTVTESAAVGAVGAFVIAAVRGKLTRARFFEVMADTTVTTALIYGLIFGALIFSFFVNMGQAADFMAQWIGSIDASPIVILALFVLFYIALGAVMDSFAVMVITVPFVTPIILGLGYDIHFWGILMLVVTEIGLITPPFGINLFVIKSQQPNVPLIRVMRGVLPFIGADIVKVALLVLFPAIALWLPSTMQ